MTVETERARTSRPRGLLIFLTGVTVVGLLALILSIQNAVDLGHESDARERERIGADVSACERGNTLRRQIRGIGDANGNMVADILDTVFVTPSDPDRAALVAAIRAKLDATVGAYRRAVGEVREVDCANVIPGAITTTTTEAKR